MSPVVGFRLEFKDCIIHSVTLWFACSTSATLCFLFIFEWSSFISTISSVCFENLYCVFLVKFHQVKEACFCVSDAGYYYGNESFEF